LRFGRFAYISKRYNPDGRGRVGVLRTNEVDMGEGGSKNTIEHFSPCNHFGALLT